MCEPATILAVSSMAMTGFSGYMQSKGERAQGIAQSNYYNYLAEQNEIQANEVLKQGNLQSKLIQDSAKEQGKELKRTQAQLSSSQIAAMAASGVDISSVSAQDITSSTKETQRNDELALRYNADIKSWGTVTDASYNSWALKEQANQARYSSRNAKWASKLQSRNTLLGTATKIAGQAATFGTAGAFSGMKLPSSGNVSGSGIFGSKLFGSTQSEILGYNTKAFI